MSEKIQSINKEYIEFFNKKFYRYVKEDYNLEEILNRYKNKDLLFIGGDFYGKQNFIFDNVVNKHAFKMLRARSAFIQLFTQYVANYICHCLQIDKECIIFLQAGKFTIISDRLEVDIKKIQEEINKYFLKNFFGLSGMLLFTYKRENFKNIMGDYFSIIKELEDEKERKKLQKFNFLEKKNETDFILSLESIPNEKICKICNMRKIQEQEDSKRNKNSDKETYCKICNIFIELGRQLANIANKNSFVCSRELGLNFSDFPCNLLLDTKIKSYVAIKQGKNQQNQVCTFEELAKSSCQGKDKGLKSLGVLKADVDGMGEFIKNKISNFKEYDVFSKSINNFFSSYVPKVLMEKNLKNTYVIFGGGDDLFLLGTWDEVLNLARKIYKFFRIFTKFTKKELNISFGVAVAKPNVPMSYLANITEMLLNNAKDKKIGNKESISVFGETAKLDKYIEINKELKKIIDINDENLNTNFYYNILEFCNMRQRLEKDFSPKDALWKSKLNYSFRKYNTQKELEDEKLDKLIKYIDDFYKAKVVKMVFSELIYLRRKDA
ncbi:type III-A CRISPR-associated protein Cas10/Csm1 [Helicobacter cetorum]|uniref:CRISPR system single-strand-specific deoxyribonuclease Cas10/Csm1 (subtype III-A) n=1 Tax=Helicobacter cetorum (strain ATCC BAA-429 / MIT 00-7128) TaxID=182217 RepID=I0EP15_HELC0|nr:hypothetical protein [Helicobacter cetorum]AFI04684.1 hypothetical protein HCW_07130 [Helicobacter cetorum MIT 00-7128]